MRLRKWPLEEPCRTGRGLCRTSAHSGSPAALPKKTTKSYPRQPSSPRRRAEVPGIGGIPHLSAKAWERDERKIKGSFVIKGRRASLVQRVVAMLSDYGAGRSEGEGGRRGWRLHGQPAVPGSGGSRRRSGIGWDYGYQRDVKRVSKETLM